MHNINKMENLDPKQANTIQLKADEIQKEFKATENQVVVLYLLKHFDGVQVSFKHKTIKGNPQKVEKSFNAIKQVQEKYKLSKIVGELSYNQKLYLTNKFNPYMFNQRQILNAINHILTKYNSSAYQNLKEVIKSKDCYVVAIQKSNANLFQSETDRLLKEKIEPNRQMIKKLHIPAIIVRTKQTNDDVEEDLIDDSSEEEDKPASFYQKIYATENKQILKKEEIKTESIENRRNRQTTKEVAFLEGEREIRQKEVLYYKSLPLKQFQRDTFKTWVNKSEYLKMVDFNIETDYAKKIIEIKLTNQVANINESKKIKEAENYLNYQSQFQLRGLRSCSYVQKVVKSYIYNDNIAYKCWVANGVLKVMGYYPKVSKIIKSIELLQQIQLFKPVRVVYKLQLGEFAPYCKYKQVKNLIIQEILRKSKQQKFYYLRTIHKFKFQPEAVKVHITRSHQKVEEELDNQFKSLLLKKNVIWDLDIEPKKIPQEIKSNYNLFPSLKEQYKLVMIAMDKKKANKHLQALIQDESFSKHEICFDIRYKPFVIDLLKDITAPTDVSPLIVDNKICISGIKRPLLQMKSEIQEKLKKFEDLQEHQMRLKKEQWMFLRESKEKYFDEFYQKYEVLMEMSELNNAVIMIGKVGSKITKAQAELESCFQNSQIVKRISWTKIKPELELKDVKVVYDENRKEIVLSGFNEKKIEAAKRMMESLQVEQKQSFDYPIFWQHQKNDIQLFQVIPGSQQYKDIASNFNVGSIKSIQRIQNKIVYRLYEQEKRFLNQLNNKKLQTRLLYHGTSKVHPAVIYEDKEQCFNINYTSDRNFLGKGIYFAVQAMYSDSYAYQSVESGIKLMLYCEVIVGESETVKVSEESRQMLDTNYKSIDRKERYESATTVTNRSQIYAIYKSRRSYPHYLIEYKK